MSPSIQSATKIGSDQNAGKLKGRKINVDLVLDRMSAFRYFGKLKGRLWSDRNFSRF